MARPGGSKRSYEDFEPFCRWERTPDRDILHVHLQGFKRQQLKIQMTSAGVMTITGERCLDREHNRWARFTKETRVPANDNIKTNEVHAKLAAGILSIVMPKKPPVIPPQPFPDAGHPETEHRDHQQQHREEQGTQEVVDDDESEGGVVGKDSMTTRKMMRDVQGVTNVVVVVVVVAVVVAVGTVLARYGFRLSSLHGMGDQLDLGL